MSADKKAEIYKKDVDVDADLDKSLHADVDVDLEADLGLSLDVEKEYTHTGIFVYAKDYDPDTTVVYKDINHEYEKDVDVEYDKSVTEKYKSEYESTSYTETWTVDVDVDADSIIQGSDIHSTVVTDVNDVDIDDLIDVDDYATLKMEDYDVDVLTVGDSFNGLGNDGQISVDQDNNLKDNDSVHDTGAHYTNSQAPNVDAVAKAGLHYGEIEAGYVAAGAVAGYEHTTTYYPPTWYKPAKIVADGKGAAAAYGEAGYLGAAHLGAALYIDAELTAPTEAFETATAHGGHATSGSGIETADLYHVALDAEGNAIVEGATEATADAAASAESFNVSVETGGNTAANVAAVNVIGGNSVDAGDLGGKLELDSNEAANVTINEADESLAIKDSWITEDIDEEVNDLDLDDLIDVDENGYVEMEDFDLDVTMIGNSFNGVGNDYQLDVTQANDIIDNDTVANTTASYQGNLWNGPFQKVAAYGGTASADDGIGTAYGSNVTLDAGGDAKISGSAAASADAIASASAFNVGVSVGANVGINQFNANVVGNDSALVDDILGDTVA